MQDRTHSSTGDHNNAQQNDQALHLLYQQTLDSVLKDELRLPSQPDIMSRVRKAIAEDTATSESITAIIAKDVGMTAFLVQAASSPVYRRPVPPKTLSEVVSLLGFSLTCSLVTLYSIRNLVELKNTTARNLFRLTWDRLVLKTSLASFFAEQLKFRPLDQVQMATMLTEIGSLSVLAKLLEGDGTLEADLYFQMCREYSKRIGCEVLTQWKADELIVKMMKDCGKWEETWSEEVNLLDIANLSLYYTVLMSVDNPSLPELETLAAYKKLPEAMRECSKPQWLSVITNNEQEIKDIINSFR